jgi:hypothetical protein
LCICRKGTDLAKYELDQIAILQLRNGRRRHRRNVRRAWQILNPLKTKNPLQERVSRKRLKGFEPSTFCMASRRSSQLSYSRAGAEYSREVGALPGV